MIYVSRAGDWPSGWADRGRRIAAAPQAPAVGGALLGLLAATESVARAAATGVSGQFVLVLCLLALATTLPLALLRPAGAAVAVSAASVLSLALFHTLTVAGLGAQLIVLYRLGRDGAQRSGAQLLAMGLAVPFLVLALAGPRPTGSEAGVLTVLLASLAPAGAQRGAGAQRRAAGHRRHPAGAHGSR